MALYPSQKCGRASHESAGEIEIRRRMRKQIRQHELRAGTRAAVGIERAGRG
jgi:hypothetical protein